jgi:hypothetical protein
MDPLDGMQELLPTLVVPVRRAASVHDRLRLLALDSQPPQDDGVGARQGLDIEGDRRLSGELFVQGAEAAARERLAGAVCLRTVDEPRAPPRPEPRVSGVRLCCQVGGSHASQLVDGGDPALAQRVPGLPRQARDERDIAFGVGQGGAVASHHTSLVA